MSVFSRFPPRLQEAIVSRLGWTSLRPVQELASQAILDGSNTIILAPTAGGKTEASAFSMLAQLMDNEPEGVGLLYIAPLKALLNNQFERLTTYTEMVGLRCFMWHGDVSQSRKNKFVEEPSHLLMTTPESLEVMLLSSRFPHKKIFHDLRAVIIDEVHALSGTDRGAHLMSVLGRLLQSTDNDIQRAGLSATVGNPETILSWLKGTSERKGAVIDPPKQPSKKDIRINLQDTIHEIAQSAVRKALGNKSLFFCQSRSLAESVADRMRDRGIDVFVHHSSVSREEREAAEERFHGQPNACIVCTSTLELGIDIGDLDLVLQVNTPSTVSSFLQRLGRTGRREGQMSNTTFFCEDPEAVLQAIAIVELAKENWVESVPQNDRCWPVLVHQLFALTLQFGAVSQEKCWETLHTIPDFSGITRAEFKELIDHLISTEFLYLSGGLLSLGDRAEETFGRKNFMELYSVFESPQLYKVKTEAGYLLGELEQYFVDKLVKDMSSFLLAGRAWTVEQINHKERSIKVKKAPRGTKPSWGSFFPQILGYELCQKIAQILRSDDRIPYIDTPAQTALDGLREELASAINTPGLHIQFDAEHALWWTFGGGQINYTLKYGIEQITQWKVVPNNFRLKIEGSSVTFSKIEEAIVKLSDNAFWELQETQEYILKSLPNYRLSKFQQTLPFKYSTEMISHYLLDVEGTTSYLNSAIKTVRKAKETAKKIENRYSSDIALFYAVPIFSTGPPKDGSVPKINNGTMTLLDLGHGQIGLTCYHVIEELSEVMNDTPDVLFFINHVPFKQIPPMIDMSRELDIAVLDLALLPTEELKKGGEIRNQFYKPPRWPPNDVHKGDIVTLGGFPGQMRLHESPYQVKFGSLSIGDTAVSSVHDDKILCHLEPDYWVTVFGSPPEGGLHHIGGLSGSPVFIWRKLFCEFVGIIYEGSVDLLYIRPAKLINNDGTINRAIYF